MVSAEAQERPGRWLTLRQACRILGVNETTLRHWADAGSIRAFRTPGGHRRFAEEDLYALMERGGHLAGAKGVGTLSEVALARIRRRLGRSRAASAPWDRAFNEGGKARMRELGRRALRLMSEYMSRRKGRSSILREIHALGEEYGQEFARDGLPLRDALEGLIFFRKSLDDTAKRLTAEEGASQEKLVETWQQITNFTDELLLALADAYEHTPSPGPKRNRAQATLAPLDQI